MTRRLAAILVADMVGYSRLMAADEEGTLSRLKDLRRDIIDPSIQGANGRIVKLTGDGLLALFDSVVAAVEAAAALQKALSAAEAANPAHCRISFRIGLHLGDVILDEGDIYGEGVNLAARLESMARPGGVLISDDAYRQVRGKTKISFVDLGDLALKNIPVPMRVYKMEMEDNPDDTIMSLQPADKPSVAVLPFQNMSNDLEQEYFCDGVSEDIITELSRFPELFVIARNSSFSFKGRPVTHHQVSRELGVRYMLEGSIRRSANRVRITAQLIDCTNGAHVWAERYDRTLENIFALQDEITRNVVGAIAPQISMAEIGRVSNAQSIDFNSYDLSLQAMAIFYAGGFHSQEKFDEVILISNRAIDLDPRNVQAHWIKAYAYLMRYLYQFDEDPAETLNLAEKSVEPLFRGGQLDPRALSVRGMVRHFRGDFDGAEADFNLGFQLNPNFARNIFFLAWHESLVGRTIEARKHAQLALQLSPRDTDLWVGDAYLSLAQAAFADADFEDAMLWGERAIQMTPRAPIRRALMIASAAHLDRPEVGRQHEQALADFAPAFLGSILSGGLVLYRLPEHNALLIDGLRKADRKR
ncbi:pH-sensitive adenylate cyclase [Ruegeria denitrificans]|uniref:pH-sensitive adenylate cyclase n=1 Tax=Ruegeria denitrificans TaxID=1715692 RepID=A0A0P1I0E0_9RHOB|nr:adenylate/guanylate cyclase domain-containing protein [Ruegeria denitrificans]CUJ82926.1 pH-sensitive adenylate cyclase [Ruegeria denitrificans]